MRTALFLGLLFLGSFSALGCAAPADDVDQSGGAMSSDDAVTAANFVSHPRIVPIRQLVAEIDRTAMTKNERNRLCDLGEDSRVAFSVGTGPIRKLVSKFIGDSGEVVTTYYYDADGGVRFIYERGTTYNGMTGAVVVIHEKRVYLNALRDTPDLGFVIIAVEREAAAEGEQAPRIDSAPQRELRPVPSFPLASDPLSAFLSPPECAVGG